MHYAPIARGESMASAAAGPDAPLLLPHRSVRLPGAHASHTLPFNPLRPTEFETPAFRGRVAVCLRGVPSGETDPWAEGARFHGRSRVTTVTVQGRFLRDVAWADALAGWEWDAPLALPFGAAAALSLFRRYYPGFVFDLRAERPFALNPVCAAADQIHVWREGVDPPAARIDIARDRVPERLLPDRWRTGRERRRELSASAAAYDGLVWEAGPEYTFDFNSDQLCLRDLSARLGGMSWRLRPYLAGQPFPILARVRGGPYLWHFHPPPSGASAASRGSPPTVLAEKSAPPPLPLPLPGQRQETANDVTRCGACCAVM